MTNKPLTETNQPLIDLLNDIADYLGPSEDADVIGGVYRANRAMQLRLRIEEEIAFMKRTAR